MIITKWSEILNWWKILIHLTILFNMKDPCIESFILGKEIRNLFKLFISGISHCLIFLLVFYFHRVYKLANIVVLIFSFLHSFLVKVPNIWVEYFTKFYNYKFYGVKEVFLRFWLLFGWQNEFLQWTDRWINSKVLIDGNKEINNTIKFKFSSVGLCHSRSTFHD